MEKTEKTQLFIDYFKSGETNTNEFHLGVENEFLVLHKHNLTAVSYYEEGGIEDILKKMPAKSWHPVYEENHLIGLRNSKAKITLEPGGQIELSIIPLKTIIEVEQIYLSFLADIIPILNKDNKILASTAYQPVTSITDIPLIPKKRYQYMFEYFKSKGEYAHHMMKGTASLQVNLDYHSEKDFIKKYVVATYLSPVIYALFDNAPFFEGEVCTKNCLRAHIWDNCDNDRCGLVPETYYHSAGYKEYAEYILNTPAIIENNGQIMATDKTIEQLINHRTKQDNLSHYLSMAFPDIRLKKYIEIRVCDILPHPLNIAYLALWKGIFYNQSSLNQIYKTAINYNLKTVIKARQKIKENGIKATIYGKKINKLGKEIYKLAENGLNKEEKIYIQPLKKILKDKIPPRQITLSNLNGNKKEALSWCFADSI